LQKALRRRQENPAQQRLWYVSENNSGQTATKKDQTIQQQRRVDSRQAKSIRKEMQQAATDPDKNRQVLDSWHQKRSAESEESWIKKS
jgi:hypothetical protein